MRRPLVIEWTDTTRRTLPDSRIVSASIQGKGKKHSIVLHTMDITLPRQSITEEDIRWVGITDQPIELYNNAVPRILLGLDNARVTFAISTYTFENLILSETPCGWTLEEQIGRGTPASGIVGVTRDILAELRKTVAQFIENDNFGVDKNNPILESDELQRARKILQEGVKMVNGKYESPLLWKEDERRLPDNYSHAKQRFLSFERKMERDPQLKQAAHETITKYLSKGYIIEVEYKPHEEGWYLPIFSVQNEKKIRLVWDAAAEFRGCSLNNQLLQGPDFNEPLWDILFRFRQWHSVPTLAKCITRLERRRRTGSINVFCGTGGKNEELRVFEMQVMTFGANCSPSIAQFVKNENARLFQETHPEGVAAILRSLYVDDWVESCRSEADAIRLIAEVIRIQKNAGFNLHKWATNSATLFEASGLDRESIKSLTGNSKTLGIKWITETDSIEFDTAKVLIPQYLEKSPTKREILRVVMSLYDPLGLVSHIVIGGRLVLRDVWKTECEWDDEVPRDIHLQWIDWLRSMKILQNLKIPRWCGVSQEQRQIHIFVDAGQAAMSAVAYVRGQGPKGITTHIVAAKCKVSPMRAISVPRLEIQAAILGVRLGEMIIVCRSHPCSTGRTPRTSCGG